jgi:hypothetical protein
MELKHGTLVRVHNAAFSGEQHIVEQHGDLWLYLLQNYGGSPDLGLCRSLATGYEHAWYDEEFEVADDEGV